MSYSHSQADILKMQAEAAVRKLSEARLHERAPKACKQCSQKHRKCQFKLNQSKCDLCAKNNRDCEILPLPASYSRKSDERGSPVSPQSPQFDRMYTMPTSPTYDRREPPHPSASSSSSHTDPRNPRGHMSDTYAYPPSNDYQYSPASSSASLSPAMHDPGYMSAQQQQQQQQQGAYTQYAPNLGHGRDAGAYYSPPHGHAPASPPSFVPSQSQWASETHRNGEVSHPQSAPPPQSQGYPYQGSSAHQASMLRQASSPASLHPGAGQPYVRTAQSYQAASPASQGGAYSVAGNAMYQMPVSPQTTSARYGANSSSQAYNQGSSVASTSAYYQQGMHQ